MQYFTTATFMIAFVAASFLVPSLLHAQPSMSVDEAPESAFEQVFTISPEVLSVPTVVEVPLPEPVAQGERFLVREAGTGKFLESYLKQEVEQLTSLSITFNSGIPVSTDLLTDDRLDTFASFAAPDEGTGQVTFTIQASQPITTSHLLLRLDAYVSLPLTVELRYREPGESELETLVAKRELTSTSLRFPEVTASYFEVTFIHIQPLRISELDLIEAFPNVEQRQFLRFLAQPGQVYFVYYGADRYIDQIETEAGDLRNDQGVFRVGVPVLERNHSYVPADTDGDGVRDMVDNCVHEYNPDQADIDRNGLGDACGDWDRDGWGNSEDNCINYPNRDQQDIDYDGVGDVCDTEESRFTERNPWVPWVGMGTAAFVLLILFTLVAKRPREGMGESREM